MIKRCLKWFFTSEIFIVLIALLGFAQWYYHFPLIVVIMGLAIIAVGIFLTCDDSRAIAPIIMFVLLSNLFTTDIHLDASENLGLEDYIIASIALVGLFTAGIFFVIKKGHRRYQNLLLEGLVAICVAYLFTGTRGDSNILNDLNITDFLIMILVCSLYFFFVYTNTKESIPYFAKTCLYMGLLITAQIGTSYYLDYLPNPTTNFVPDVMWASHNNIALIMLMLCGISIYLIYLTKNYFIKAIYGLLCVIAFFGLLLTTSRGGILAGLLEVVFVIIAFYFLCRKKKTFWITTSICFVVTVTTILIFQDAFLNLFQIAFHDGLDDSSRFELYHIAWGFFLSNSISGIGTNLSPLILADVADYWFHSTILDIFANFGLVGAACFEFHFMQKYKMLAAPKTSFKIFATIGLVGAAIYGLIDVYYFAVNCLIFYMIILAFAEISAYSEPTKKAITA